MVFLQETKIALLLLAVFAVQFSQQQSSSCYEQAPTFFGLPFCLGCWSAKPGRNFAPVFSYRYYYTANSGCLAFFQWFSCSTQTGNNFANKQECEQACTPRPESSTTAALSIRSLDIISNRPPPPGPDDFGDINSLLPEKLSENPRCNTPVYSSNSNSLTSNCVPAMQNAVVKFQYDTSVGECSAFVYDGCRPTRNMFDTMANCERACKMAPVPKQPQITTTMTAADVRPTMCPPGVRVVNCLVNPCDVTKCAGTCVADYCGGCNAICLN